jgi:hypothetical protein
MVARLANLEIRVWNAINSQKVAGCLYHEENSGCRIGNEDTEMGVGRKGKFVARALVGME